MAAKNSIINKSYEWACFQAQQAAEKALKAYLYLKGKRLIISHSIFKLIKECLNFDNEFKNILDARELDKYYIPTRYPNGLPDQIPHEFYNLGDAKLCVDYAEKILSLIKKLTTK